jgi:hypothetical protein
LIAESEWWRVQLIRQWVPSSSSWVALTGLGRPETDVEVPQRARARMADEGLTAPRAGKLFV